MTDAIVDPIPGAGLPGAWRTGWAGWSLGALVLCLLAVLYWDGVGELLLRWAGHDEFSHGYLIPVVALFLAWQQRGLLAGVPFTGSWAGVVLLLLGLFMYFAGTLGTIFMVVHYSLVLVLFSLALSYTGWGPMRYLWAAFFYLIFMIPFPPFLLNQLSLALQLISSELGVAFIAWFGIPVFVEGNVIDLGIYKLQVVDACSGLRYLFPLMSFGFLIAYLFKGPLWQRVVVFLSTIPITVLMNSFRIGVVGLLVQAKGIEMAEGFLHDFEGWLIFVACTLLLLGEVWLFVKLGGRRRAFADAFRLDDAPLPPASVPRATRPVPRPFWAAVAILGLSVALAQALDARAPSQPQRMSFAMFPDRIGAWNGQPETLESQVLEALDLDDYFIADFIAGDDRAVNFYVAYYGSQDVGEAAHSPRSCIPGGGWKIVDLQTHVVDDVRVRGEPLRVNRLKIQRGTTKQLVYYWFQQRDRILTSEYAVKWFLFWDGLTRNRTDGALLRLTTVVPPWEDWEDGDRRLTAFARDLYPELSPFLPD